MVTKKGGLGSLRGSQNTSNSLYAITAAIIALYCIGHTLGAVVESPFFSASAAQVLVAMRSVDFPCSGSTCSWFGLYHGFGIIVSIFLGFAAILTYLIGRLELATRIQLRPVVVSLAIAFGAMAVVSELYFFVQPLALSIIIAGLLTTLSFEVTFRRGVKKYLEDGEGTPKDMKR